MVKIFFQEGKSEDLEDWATALHDLGGQALEFVEVNL